MPLFFKSRTFYIATSVVVAGAAFGAFLCRRKILKIRKCELKALHVDVVSNIDQWNTVAEKVKKACYVQQVVGLDCEWKAQFQKNEPGSHLVALLQIATSEDSCILIRLNKFGKMIPSDLRSLLKDKSVLKVGVAVNEDSKKLMDDYGLLVQGCLDLRHLVDRSFQYAKLDRKGLKSLAENVVGVKIKKNSRIRLSDWEADELTDDQIKYASEDAIIAVMIFNHLVSHLLLTWQTCLMCKRFEAHELYKGALDLVGHLIDHRYRASVSPAKNKPKMVAPVLAGKQQTRSYSARQSPLYHNCQIQAPDGEPLCTCDTKKAMWYLQRDLAVTISDEPLVVRLKFEPAGRPILDNKYYVEEKENQCVVCGRQESLVRKIVIPHEYRKYFPDIMKNHLSHDVLLLCLECHMVSNNSDCILRMHLSVECGAPLGSGLGAKIKEDPQLKKVKSAGRALLHHSDQIPEMRKDKLINILKDFYQVSDITESLLQVAAEIETNVDNESFEAHGKKVVEYKASHGGLLDFETMWRKHFLDTMRPRFLPKMWSIDHNHQRIALVVAEKKDFDFDIKILGPLPVNHITDKCL